MRARRSPSSQRSSRAVYAEHYPSGKGERCADDESAGMTCGRKMPTMPASSPSSWSRGPGHTTLDDKIYHRGLLDFKADIATALSNLDFLHDPGACDRQEELRAMAIAADAVIRFAESTTPSVRLSSRTSSRIRYDRRSSNASPRCARGYLRTPRATSGRRCDLLVRASWRHDGVGPWDAFSRQTRPAPCSILREGPGEGTLTRESAEELLQCFWIKFNNRLRPHPRLA